MHYFLMNSVKKLVVLILAIGLMSPLLVDSQAAPKTKNKSAATIREEQVLQLTVEFEKALRELAKNLKQTEPENAKRLEEALNYMNQQRLKGNMVDVIKLLNSAEFNKAISSQEGLVKDIAKLIKILSTDESDTAPRITELLKWKKTIKKLIAEEANHRRDSHLVKNKKEIEKQYDEAINELNQLIEKQDSLIKKTKNARAGRLKDLEQAASLQRKIREKTEALRKKIGKIGNPDKGSPNKGTPDKGKAGKNQLPGQKPLATAAVHQSDAEQDLENGKGKAAEVDELKAAKQLKKALAKLKKERNRIAQLKPEDLAEPQDQTAKATDQVKGEIQETKNKMPPKGKEKSKSQPGLEAIKKAHAKMKVASKKLGNGKPGSANDDQQDAEDDLRRALEEIDAALAQLREQEQQEKLAALEAHFRLMLEIQEEITKQTLAMNKKRVAKKFNREDKLVVKHLSGREAKLSLMAQTALDILLEDATSIVFPRIVKQLGSDLNSVSDLLRAQKTGRYTQSIQLDIEATLKELIVALEIAKNPKNPKPSPPGNDPPSTDPPEPPPLLPDSAELKLLKNAQLRVNRRTKIFDDIRPDGTLHPVLQGQVKIISKHQKDVAEMTREIVERN